MATTRYVVASGGVTSGNATSVGTGWTLAYALSPGVGGNALAAGDTLVICQGDYPVTFATLILVNCATGTASFPIRIVGGTAAGAPYTDGTRVRIYATGTAGSWGTGGASAPVIINTVANDGTTAIQYFIWENILVDSASVAYNSFSNGGSANTFKFNVYHQFINCGFTGSKHNSFSTYGYSSGTTEVPNAFCFFGCSFYNNGATSSGAGIVSRTSDPCSFALVNCECYGNKLGGFKSNVSSYGNTLINCLFYGQTASGLSGYGANVGNSPDNVVVGNTFYGNGGDGLIINAAPSAIVSGNIFSSNTGAGINDSGYDSTYSIATYQRNCYWNNTAGNFLDASSLSVTPPGLGNVLKNPMFIGASTTTPNLGVMNGSPVVNAGGYPLNGLPLASMTGIGASSSLTTLRGWRGR